MLFFVRLREGQADLMELRDRLKVAISTTHQEPGTEAALNPQDLADRIRALKDSHTLDSPPQAQRLGTRSPSAERPVTARIRERQDLVSIDPWSGAEEGPTPEPPSQDAPAPEPSHVDDLPLAAAAELLTVAREYATMPRDERRSGGSSSWCHARKWPTTGWATPR